MTTEELQAQKLQLEVDKLSADNERSNKLFLKTADFWKAIIPILITTCGLLVTLYFTVGRSFIDDEKRKLELQKEQLKLEVMRFENDKIDIQKQIKISTIDKNSLNTQIISLSSQRQKLSYNIVALQQKFKSLTRENKNLRFSYTDDTAFYHRELKKAYLYEKQYLQKLADELVDKNARIASLTVGYNYLSKKIKLDEAESQMLAANRLEASTKVYEQKAIESHIKAITPKNKNNKIKTSKDFQRWLDLYFLGKTNGD
jgi:regulator of replication initiation timing